VTDLTDRLTSGNTARFREAWEAARGDKDLPTRADISLRLFFRFISDMSAYQRFGPREFRYCQVGEGVKTRLELSRSDTNIFDFIHPDIVEGSQLFWDLVTKAPCGGLQHYSMVYPHGMLRRAVSIVLPVYKRAGGALVVVA
jgi:hypothetical protein